MMLNSKKGIKFWYLETLKITKQYNGVIIQNNTNFKLNVLLTTLLILLKFDLAISFVDVMLKPKSENKIKYANNELLNAIIAKFSSPKVLFKMRLIKNGDR